jgi:hypothetical protein
LLYAIPKKAPFGLPGNSLASLMQYPATSPGKTEAIKKFSFLDRDPGEIYVFSRSIRKTPILLWSNLIV